MKSQAGSGRESTEALLREVRRLYGAMERFDARTAAALGIDRTAVRALNLMESGAVSPGTIAAELGLTSGSVTALLDRLESAGLVARRIADDDARRRDATLTPTGRRRAHQHYEALGRRIAASFAHLTAADAEAARATLRRLAEAFDGQGD